MGNHICSLYSWSDLPTRVNLGVNLTSYINSVKKLPIIREILKGDHNAMAAVAARKLKQKQISALSETLKYEAVKFIN